MSDKTSNSSGNSSPRPPEITSGPTVTHSQNSADKVTSNLNTSIKKGNTK